MSDDAPRLPLSKRLQYRIEWSLTVGLIGVCATVPLIWLRRAGAGLGWLAWRILRVRRRVVIDNIARSFPEANETAVDAIALESYRQYGMSLMEFAAFRRLSREKILEMVEIQGMGNLDAALAHGRGAVLFTGHFGNWELLGAVVARSGYPLHVTDTNHTNKSVHHLISDLRIRQGMKIIAPSEPLSRNMRILSENGFVAYLADQDARGHGIFVDFFGRPASTVRGPAVCAVRRQCPIVATFLIREGYDRHRAVFEEPLWPVGGRTSAEAVQELTQRFTRMLEGYVRTYPGQYFWMHRRWKTKPPHAAGE
jgi:KDO2-lipid IV(A) lauroyltransferase